MNRKIYLQPMKFMPYDNGHVIAYLNEEVIEGFVPDDGDPIPHPVTAYAYTGPEADGGTLLDVSGTDRDSLINAIIRTHYSQSEEDALKTHQILLLQNPDHPKKSDYQSEWSQFLVERQYAIDTVDAWLQ